MAYATLMEFPVDLDTHLKIMAAVGEEPAEGLIVHAAGPTEHGIRSLDVWESKEHSTRFFTERMMPALNRLGHRGGPPPHVEEFDLPIVLRGTDPNAT